MFEELTVFIALIFGYMIGRITEKSKWIEKYVDLTAIKGKLRREEEN